MAIGGGTLWDNAMGDTYINRNNHTGVTRWRNDPVTGGQDRKKHGDDRRQVGAGHGYVTLGVMT